MSNIENAKRTDLSGAARSMKLITKGDTVDSTTGPHRGFFIQAAATLKITTYSNDEITATFPAGYNPIIIKRVWSTGSDAVSVWGLI